MSFSRTHGKSSLQCRCPLTMAGYWPLPAQRIPADRLLTLRWRLPQALPGEVVVAEIAVLPPPTVEHFLAVGVCAGTTVRATKRPRAPNVFFQRRCLLGDGFVGVFTTITCCARLRIPTCACLSAVRSSRPRASSKCSVILRRASSGSRLRIA